MVPEQSHWHNCCHYCLSFHTGVSHILYLSQWRNCALTCCLHLDMFSLSSHASTCQAVSLIEGRVRSDWAITDKHQEYRQAQTTSGKESASNKPPSIMKQSTWHPISKPDLPPYLSPSTACFLLIVPIASSPHTQRTWGNAVQFWIMQEEKEFEKNQNQRLS